MLLTMILGEYVLMLWQWNEGQRTKAMSPLPKEYMFVVAAVFVVVAAALVGNNPEKGIFQDREFV